MKFRKKPVIVEAIQWFKNGDHSDVHQYPSKYGDGNEFCQYCNSPMHSHGWIINIVSGRLVCPGDWIVVGPNEEIYSCKPNDFKACYDKEHSDAGRKAFLEM